MPRTLPRLTLLLALLACGGAVIAQTAAPVPPPAPPAPPAPPGSQQIEAGSDVPTLRVEPKRGTQIREKRSNGQVSEVEVQSGKSRYTMKSNQPAGSAPPIGDAQSSLRAPQWQVMEFDLNGKKKAAAQAAADAAAAAQGTPQGAAAAATQPAALKNVPAASVDMTRPADIPPPPPLPATR